MSEWQPAETAPKDGTEVLAYTNDGSFDLVEWNDLTEQWWNGNSGYASVLVSWQALTPPPGVS
jgi:hypothetical protein